jgi:hypothetical protein
MVVLSIYSGKQYTYVGENNTGIFMFVCTKVLYEYIDFFVLNATFSNFSAISWQPVLVVHEAVVHGENHRPWASNW